jgi:hypothetical protein
MEHAIDKKTLKIKTLEQVLIEKVCQLFSEPALTRKKRAAKRLSRLLDREASRTSGEEATRTSH